MPTATGTFAVKFAPQPPSAEAEAATIGRLALNKQFSGDLSATSQGEMLSFRTAIEDSAGYVAIERVSGTLHGHHGTFALQHSGIMNRGTAQLALSVIPDSGTDALTGLAGTMAILITDGQHTYTFEYTLPTQTETA